MTKELAARIKLSTAPRFSLDLLRSLRAEVDSILGFLQSGSTVEKDNGEEERGP
jgi:hypothetical protein